MLAAGTALVVAVPFAPAFAQALPVQNDAATFQSYTRSAFTNYVKRVGPGLSAAQRATIAAAANDNLAATAARVGARSGAAMLAPYIAGSAIVPIVAGVVIVGAIAAAGYIAYKYWGSDRANAGGKSSTTTYEQALASSNWSMRNKPNWSLWKQVNTGSGWEADWLWTPPAGKTQADFNHATDVAPYQTTKVTPAEIHKALDTADQTLPIADPWMVAALHGLAVETAKTQQAAGTPLPGPFADPVSVPVPIPADLPAPATNPRPGPGAASKPIPGPDGSTATPPDLASDPNPNPNPDPDPDPDPDPNPDPDPDPGTEGPPLGEEVTPDGVGELPGYEEFASPFRTLFDPFKAIYGDGAGSSCPSITWPGMDWGAAGSSAPITINQHCTLFEPLKPAIMAASAAAGGWAAMSHIVDA
jgi:hypothetical protein